MNTISRAALALGLGLFAAGCPSDDAPSDGTETDDAGTTSGGTDSTSGPTASDSQSTTGSSGSTSPGTTTEDPTETATSTTTSPGTTTDPTTGEDTSTGPGNTTTDSSSSGSGSGSESGSSSGSTTTGDTEDTEDTNGDELPDIDLVAATADISSSVYTETRNFAANSCALEEACVVAAGERRLLRFTTVTPNVGPVDLVVGNPNDNPELFEFGACHGHYHFLDYANYRLLDGDGNVAAVGHKQAFALIDLSPWDDNAGPPQFPLNDGTQGISSGWADIYDASLDCQWVDITGVAPGDYTLEIHVNFEQVLEESDYDNNLILVPVTIDDGDPPPPEVPDEWTCNVDYYSTNDGCDCGCGALDPDCMNPTVSACEFCGGPGSCADDDCGNVQVANNAVCM